MKTVKLLFAIALVSMVTFSCKEAKKESVEEDATMEMMEEGEAAAEQSEAEKSTDLTEGEGSEEAAMEPSKAVEGATKGLEEMPVTEGVLVEAMADTPVIYPGCGEGTPDEIRACSKEKYIAFLKDEFNVGLAKDWNLAPGDHMIRSMVKIDEKGKCSLLEVKAPNDALAKEMERVINKLPQMTAATKGGEPVAVQFLLPLNFKVED